MIGYIPVKLVLLVAIGVLATVWAVLRSLFVRRRPGEDPGRRILHEHAPMLWQVLREVAQKVGTRPVDKVFLTMGTEMAVTERGPLSKRLRDQGERILILGASLLSSLTTSELKALLAHEYGHFSNRDTAGGDVAMTVNASLLSTALSLARSGVSALNPAWQFLKVYSGLFARITQGASRLQEILADRFSALQYGPAAFAGGLTAAVRRQVLFNAEVNEQVRVVGVGKQPIKNLYTPPAFPAERIVGLDAQLREAMEAKASEFDSHPPPNQRIELVSRYPEPSAASEPDDEAWSLIPNRASFEADFTWKVNEQLRDQGLLPAGADQPQTITL
jgi:Zn-dependent protease with chaperone function